MSSEALKSVSSARPLSATAVALMVMLCLSWGFNQIAIKFALPDIPPLLQATIRSVGGLMIILLVAWLRGVPMFKRDGTLRAGLLAGIFFGLEFILIYRGLLYTTASRAVVFLYVAPFVVALGARTLCNSPTAPFMGVPPRVTNSSLCDTHCARDLWATYLENGLELLRSKHTVALTVT